MGMLKSLVIGMGILVVAGMGLLGYGLYQKANNPDFDPFGVAAKKAEQPAPQGASQDTYQGGVTSPPKPFEDIRVSIPEGCRLEQTQPTRGARLFLTIGPADGSCSRVVVVDMVSGSVLGSVLITNETAP